MSEGRHESRSLSDEQVEALLVDFFRRETPVEWREPLRNGGSPPAPPRNHSAAGERRPVLIASSGASSSSGTGAKAPTLLVTGLALLLAASLTLNGPAEDGESPTVQSAGTASDLASSSGSRQRAAAADHDEDGAAAPVAIGESRRGPLPFAIADDRVESEERMQYDTAEGPVEQRMERRIRNVSIYDPETGSRLEVTIPEVTIEIFPIEDDK